MCQDVVNALFFLALLVVVLSDVGGHGGRLLLFLVLRLVLAAAVNVTPEVAAIGQRVEVQTLGEDVWSIRQTSRGFSRIFSLFFGIFASVLRKILEFFDIFKKYRCLWLKFS